MDAACGEKEDVAVLDRIFRQSVGDGVVLHHLLILCRCDLLLQAAAQRGRGVAFHHIPHLGLAARQPLLLSLLVVGVHLDGELLARVDKLDEQGKQIAVARVVLLADQQLLLLRQHVVEFPALVFAVGDNSLVVFHARHLPALAHLVEGLLQVLERDNLVTTPNRLLQ